MRRLLLIFHVYVVNGVSQTVLFDLPKNRDTINNTRKIKNKTLAMEAAPAAIPPNPKIAAMMATTRKITVQRSINNLF